MRSIDPNRVYSSEELKQVIGGHISIQLLRKYGLKGLPTGYFGGAVIQAINNYCSQPKEKQGHTESVHYLSGGQGKRSRPQKISDKDIGIPSKVVSHVCYDSKRELEQRTNERISTINAIRKPQIGGE